MKKTQLAILLATIIGSSFLVRTCWPKIEPIDNTVPAIKETVVETVTVTPKWLKDSLRAWKRQVFSDSVNVHFSTTIIEPDTMDLSNPENASTWVNQLWPILTVSVDTVNKRIVSNTYSVRTGEIAITTSYLKGPLLFIGTDSLPQPRYDFGKNYEQQYHVKFKDKMKYAFIGGVFITTVTGMAYIWNSVH